MSNSKDGTSQAVTI